MFHFSDKKTSKGKDSRNDTSDEDEGSQQGKQLLILLLSCIRYTLELQIFYECRVVFYYNILIIVV